jgi:uncharacterized membrane protein
MTETIGNPLSWSVDAAKGAGSYVGSVTARLGSGDTEGAAMPIVRRIGMEDLRASLRAGYADFVACRSDVVFLCLIYPAIGLVLAWAAFSGNLLPLVFPILSGFALIGPVAAVGLYEMSRRREAGQEPSWGDAFGVLKSPSFGAIFVLGVVLFAIFLVWIITAHGIWSATLGPVPPTSLGVFLSDVFTTGAGWAMMVLGLAIGFLFAALVLAISVVSFPLLLDRDVGLPVAIVTSFRVATENPAPVAVWGLIVAVGLALGSLPFLLGLIVVLPVLGHATWHLYRRAVESGPTGRPAAG